MLVTRLWTPAWTTFIGGVWVRMTHDATSDGVLISTKRIRP